MACIESTAVYGWYAISEGRSNQLRKKIFENANIIFYKANTYRKKSASYQMLKDLIASIRNRPNG